MRYLATAREVEAKVQRSISMQNDTLTLSVDMANNGTPEDQVYSRYDESSGRSTYIGATHTPGDRNMLTLTRALPKRVGNFKGVSKSTIKLTRDTMVPGVDANTSVSAPIIIEVSFSFPVGVDATAAKNNRQRIVALLDDDSIMDKLNVQLMV